MKKPRVVILVQARMGSTRLPGKTLKEVLGKPLLFYLMERLRRVQLADEIVLATTDLGKDDPLVVFCKEQKIPFFRGSEEDVLDRFYEAGKQFKADIVVRITGDCPLMDPQLVDEGLAHFFQTPHLDYQSNALKRTLPLGMEIEIFTFKSFIRVKAEAKWDEEKEHVTPYYYRHPELFKIENMEGDGQNSHLRLTVDTPEDFQLVNKILENLYPKKKDFGLKDILDLLKQNPQWVEINAHIQQKKLND